MKEGNEISNFKLWYNGLFRVEFLDNEGKANSFPISLNPIELTLLFEMEGLNMKIPSRYNSMEEPEYDFKKVILIKKWSQLILFDEVNVDISPIICEIKPQD